MVNIVMTDKTMDGNADMIMKSKDPLAWKEVSTETIVSDQWIDFRKTDYMFPDGRVIGPFYSYTRRDYAVIVATDEEGRYICVRQFRQGIKEVTTEFPAGGLEDSESAATAADADDANGATAAAEDADAADGATAEARALAAAKRELLEETGYESDEWTHLMTLPSSATISDNIAYIFKAENCRRVTGQSLDETEFLNATLLSADEIEEMVMSGGFKQAMHVTAWLLANRTGGSGTDR